VLSKLNPEGCAAAERKSVFRSTAFPADKALVRGSNLDKLVDEILGIIKN